VSRYRFIEAEKVHHAVNTLCRVMKVSRATYYVWIRGLLSERARVDRELSERIVSIHTENYRAYGAPRVHAELRAQGVRVGRKRVARLMRLAGIAGWTHRKFRGQPTAIPFPPLPDLVQRDFQPNAINQLWCADITYIRTREGWLYLAVIMDCWSRRIVGWALATHLRTELVLEALEMAVAHRQPTPGVVFHSDRGCQYTSMAFGTALRKSGLVQSVGRPASCWDNIVAESFFATFKKGSFIAIPGRTEGRRSWPSSSTSRSSTTVAGVTPRSAISAL
jgi:putative transposase